MGVGYFADDATYFKTLKIHVNAAADVITVHHTENFPGTGGGPGATEECILRQVSSVIDRGSLAEGYSPSAPPA